MQLLHHNYVVCEITEWKQSVQLQSWQNQRRACIAPSTQACDGWQLNKISHSWIIASHDYTSISLNRRLTRTFYIYSSSVFHVCTHKACLSCVQNTPRYGGDLPVCLFHFIFLFQNTHDTLSETMGNKRYNVAMKGKWAIYLIFTT